MRTYTPKQKKPVKLAIQTKKVRIDYKTEIEVSVATSDEDARKHFWLRNKSYPHPKPIMPIIPEADIAEGVSQEELVGIIDDENLPEIE
jgi:hypothetical protein